MDFVSTSGTPHTPLSSTTSNALMPHHRNGAQQKEILVSVAGAAASYQHKPGAAGNDEELTSLNWLHDKNLLRGINLTCTPSAPKTAATTTAPTTAVAQKPAAKVTAVLTVNPNNTTTTTTTCPQSPTSDYMDESFASQEHNISSSSSVSSTLSPASSSAAGNGHFENVAVTVYPSHSAASNAAITLNSHNNNNSTSTANKNTPQILTAGRPFTTQPAAQIIHLSPGGTTVIEYKSATQLHPKSPLQSAASSATNNAAPSAATAAAATATSSTSTSSVVHFHKKYLREEHQKAIMKQSPFRTDAAEQQQSQHPNAPSPPRIATTNLNINLNSVVVVPTSAPTAVSSHPPSSSAFHHSHHQHGTVDTHPSNTTVTLLDAVPAPKQAHQLQQQQQHVQSTADFEPQPQPQSELHYQQLQIQLDHDHNAAAQSPHASGEFVEHHHIQDHQQQPQQQQHYHHHHQIIDHHAQQQQQQHLVQQLLQHQEHNSAAGLVPGLMDVIDYASASPSDAGGTSPRSGGGKHDYIGRAESISSPDSCLSAASSPHSTPSKTTNNSRKYLQQQQRILEQQLHSPLAAAANGSSNSTPPSAQTNGGAGTNAAAGKPPKHHPTNFPYDPLVHTANKPPLSFSSLIFLAIDDSVDKALPVKEIYAWIVAHYPYFKTAPTGWKNSVRHNLSLNKCFQKVEKAPVRTQERFLRGVRRISYIFRLGLEHGQGIAVARRTAIQTEPDPGADALLVPSVHDDDVDDDNAGRKGRHRFGQRCCGRDDTCQLCGQ